MFGNLLNKEGVLNCRVDGQKKGIGLEGQEESPLPRQWSDKRGKESNLRKHLRRFLPSSYKFKEWREKDSASEDSLTIVVTKEMSNDLHTSLFS